MDAETKVKVIQKIEELQKLEREATEHAIEQGLTNEGARQLKTECEAYCRGLEDLDFWITFAK